MTLTAWLVVAGVAWMLAAVGVAIVVGRIAARRDRQRPRR
jgi:hypothetical protein